MRILRTDDAPTGPRSVVGSPLQKSDDLFRSLMPVHSSKLTDVRVKTTKTIFQSRSNPRDIRVQMKEGDATNATSNMIS